MNPADLPICVADDNDDKDDNNNKRKEKKELLNLLNSKTYREVLRLHHRHGILMKLFFLVQIHTIFSITTWIRSNIVVKLVVLVRLINSSGQNQYNNFQPSVLKIYMHSISILSMQKFYPSANLQKSEDVKMIPDIKDCHVETVHNIKNFF